jgi:RimJ/RimL family protein N-acetyltransferase
MGVELKPIDKVSLDFLERWQNDKEIKFPLMSIRFPIQRKSIENWLESLRTTNGISQVVFGIFSSENPVGMVSLKNIDYISRKCSLGIYIGEKANNNKGIGYIASQLAIDFSFNGLGMNRVELEVLSYNLNAISLYEKIGFSEEGIKRKAFFINGDFLDITIMSILTSEFKLRDELVMNRLVI